MPSVKATTFSIECFFSKKAQVCWLAAALLVYTQPFKNVCSPATISDILAVSPTHFKTGILIFLLTGFLAKIFYRINDYCKPKYPHNNFSNDHHKQVILVIGGSRGLGFELIKLFLERTNCKVCLLDRIETSISPEKYPNFFFYKIDVADLMVLISTFDKIHNQVGPVTTLINNVGVAPMKHFAEMSATEIQRVISVNLTSYLLSMNYFLSYSLKSNSSLYIMNIASVLGLVSPAYLAIYSATKAAIIAAHESIFHEIANSSNTQIGLLLVKIGQLDTTLFAKVNPPRQFLAPVLSHQDLALKLWQKWLNGQVGEVSWPGYAHFGSIFKILPYTIVEPLRRFARIDKSLPTTKTYNDADISANSDIVSMFLHNKVQ